MGARVMREVRPEEVPIDGGTAVQDDPARPVFRGNGADDWLCAGCGNVLAAGMDAGYMTRRVRIRCGRCRMINVSADAVLMRLVPGDPDSEAADALEGAVVEHNPCLSGGALEIFLEPHLPAPRMVIAGTSPIARALGKVASAAGYDVAAEGVGPGDAALVVASHGVAEEQALAEALRAGVPYVALVASRTRGEAVRAALEVPEELRGQLKTPAGLAIGARTPEEIAISILAEVVAERHAHPAGAHTVVGASVNTATDPICARAATA